MYWVARKCLSRIFSQEDGFEDNISHMKKIVKSLNQVVGCEQWENEKGGQKRLRRYNQQDLEIDRCRGGYKEVSKFGDKATDTSSSLVKFVSLGSFNLNYLKSQ